jgi:hypothetical protein
MQLVGVVHVKRRWRTVLLWWNVCCCRLGRVHIVRNWSEGEIVSILFEVLV